MPEDAPQKVSFILHFSRSEDSRWTGRLEEVEQGEVLRFVCIDSLVEQFANHGVRLLHRKRAAEICANCERLGGTPMEGQ